MSSTRRHNLLNTELNSKQDKKTRFKLRLFHDNNKKTGVTANLVKRVNNSLDVLVQYDQISHDVFVLWVCVENDSR